MRLGPKERSILVACAPAGWTPPSVYLPEYSHCPSGYSLNRLVDKGLAEFRYMTMTAAEHRANTRAPGRETAEHNAALRLTAAGAAARAALLARDPPQ